MKVVMAAVGTRGDAAPFAALGRRLVARGHDVTLVTHRSLAGHLPDGLHVVGVDSDPRELLAGPAGQALRRGHPRALNRTRHHFAAFLRSFAEPTRAALCGADVLLASTFAVAAVDVALAEHVPVVRAHMWPESETMDGPMPLTPYAWRLPTPVRRGARRAFRNVEPFFAGVEGEWHRGRLDLRRDHPVGLTTSTLGALYAYSPLVDAAPGTPERALATGWWRETTSAALSERTAALLDDGPWIAVGFGSMLQNRPDALVETVSRACQRVGVRALLQLDGAPTDPSGTVVSIGDEPHDALFARLSAVVHHGGSGTTGATLCAGTPSVVVPHFADQYHWAHRLDSLGAAPAPLPRALLTETRLARRIEKALAPTTVARASELGRGIACEDGVGVAAARLEALVTGGA